MLKRSPLSIGQIADRTGLAQSAIRYYEAQGLVHPVRNAGGQRCYAASDLRRLSFVMIAQRLGFTIKEIRAELDRLPNHKAPTKADWSRISRHFSKVLDQRIAEMQRLRTRLDGCIGCGCLSLAACQLYNPKDKAARLGGGPRYVITRSPVE